MRIRISGLDFQYRKGPFLFKNINLEIPLDGLVVVTGNSGSGKTTLIKLIAGLLTPVAGQIKFDFNGKPVDDIQFGYLFQNPDDQIVHFNLERELAFNLENRGIPVAEMHRRVEDYLYRYDLADRRNDSPNRLSGGEKQRLALAGMMISCPGIMILDEPCSFLDSPAQVRLYKQIAALRKEGVSVIWVSKEDHEIRLADYVIELDSGEVSWSGQSDEYLKRFENSHAA
ncbi:MAG TPA: ABC transporter ATP-binding protein [Candidatus Marinimicrobia bacterium]|nr:ABC transporter ATP-binding protein [Candidatus Neomarinimicrobiota bacterium]